MAIDPAQLDDLIRARRLLYESRYGTPPSPWSLSTHRTPYGTWCHAGLAVLPQLHGGVVTVTVSRFRARVSRADLVCVEGIFLADHAAIQREDLGVSDVEIHVVELTTAVREGRN